jgi:hypothetical protein
MLRQRRRLPMPNSPCGDSVCIEGKDELEKLREQVAKFNWYIAQDLAQAFDGLASTLATLTTSRNRAQAMLGAAITLIAEADPCPMPGGHACCTDVSFCEECVRDHLDKLAKEASQ